MENLSLTSTEEVIDVGTQIDQYVSFRLADEEYAIDIKHIQEVIRLPKITLVPQMPNFVLGVVNIRGRIVPVFDLRRKFKLTEKETDSSTKLIVGNMDGGLVSFIIDEILDNIKLERSKIDPAPSVKNNIDRDCIDGIGVFSQRMIILINFIKINDNISRSIKSDAKSDNYE